MKRTFHHIYGSCPHSQEEGCIGHIHQEAGLLDAILKIFLLEYDYPLFADKKLKPQSS